MNDSLSSVHLRVLLPSGNWACYKVQPQHLPRKEIPGSEDWPRKYGQQIAHALDGDWFYPGGWEPVPEHIVDAIRKCQEIGP